MKPIFQKDSIFRYFGRDEGKLSLKLSPWQYSSCSLKLPTNFSIKIVFFQIEVFYAWIEQSLNTTFTPPPFKNNIYEANNFLPQQLNRFESRSQPFKISLNSLRLFYFDLDSTIFYVLNCAQPQGVQAEHSLFKETKFCIL